MRWTLALSLWTLFVWVGRVRNILRDDSLEGSELVWRSALAVGFVALAVVTLGAIWHSRRASAHYLGWLVRFFAVFTAVVWVARALGILLDGSHAAGFKVVHTVLAIVSITLAWFAGREISETTGTSDRTSAAVTG